MNRWKYSQYNINLKEEGYQNAKENEYYNIALNRFVIIPKDVDLENPSEELKGFLVPSNLDENGSYIEVQDKLIYENYPQSVRLTIATTMQCNYRCKYCFEMNKQRTPMTDETLKDIIAYIRNEIDRNQNLKTLRIKWFGGEPLMNLRCIREISSFVIPYAESKGIKYSAEIITNGYLYTKAVSEELRDYKVDAIQIAIDGFEENYVSVRQAKADAYKKVIQNIEDSVIPITIRINTNRSNYKEILALVRKLSTLSSVKNGFNHLMIARVKDYDFPLQYGFTDKEWLEFRKCYEEIQDVLPTILEKPPYQ